MGKPKIPDIATLIQAGIDPNTGKPIKLGNLGLGKVNLKVDIKAMLRKVDEQDACNRYVWYNLPMDLPSQEVERMLYYKGQLAFFYDKDLDKFFFTPYALDGTIDAYGRYNSIHPVPMTSGTAETEGQSKALAQYFASKKLKCIYGIKQIEDLKIEDLTESCVLLHDYTKQLGQTIIPRAQGNDALLDVMAECVPFMRTSLLLSTGVRAMRVSDADQKEDVWEANRSMERAALTGEPLVPTVGAVDFQELTGVQLGKSEEYMLAMQSLDNLRLATYGLPNSGLFEKKAHELQTEADINGGPVGLILQDGLSIRQNFCNIVNSIWGTSIWCEPAENIANADLNGDGLTYDRDEGGEHTGVESENYSGGEENE